MNDTEQRRTQADANIDLLPERAFSVHPSRGILIELRRGESGFIPWTIGPPPPGEEAPSAAEIARGMNRSIGVTEAEAEAMLNGSMFGWHVPAANVGEIERMMRQKH